MECRTGCDCICHKKPLEYYLAMGDKSPFYEEKIEIRKEDGTLTTVLTIVKVRKGINVTQDMVPVGYRFDRFYPDTLLVWNEFTKESSPGCFSIEGGLEALLERVRERLNNLSKQLVVDSDLFMMSLDELRQEAMRLRKEAKDIIS